VIVDVSAELYGPADPAAEAKIVSQWTDISADEKHQVLQSVNELLRPLGLQTSLLAMRRAESIALFFLCMSLSAVMSLRDHWHTGRLRDIVQELFTILAGNTWPDGRAHEVIVKRLTWPVTEYERCLAFFKSLQGKHTVLLKIIDQGSWITEVKLLYLRM